MANTAFEKKSQRMLDCVRTLQKITMFCEKILSSDIKDDLICFVINREFFSSFPRIEPEVLAVML